MKSLTIAPIGTCRIHTPLRSGVGKYPIALSLGRNYGFVHTSAEVLQQVNYMFGYEQISDELRPLIFRPNTPSAFDSAAHVPADLYFIELSSRKLLQIDGVPIQLNYVARRYQDFFANKTRSRMFWSRAVPEKMAERKALLLEDPVFQRLSAEDADLLCRIVRRDLSDAEIGRDMARLIEIIGVEKIVFVTHVNADTPDGTPIAARQQLIETVLARAGHLKAACYDPTALMKGMGQLRAMENDGLDLTHYTDAFSARLCAVFYERFIAEKLPAPLTAPEFSASSDLAETPADFAKQWADGDHLDASRRLHDYVRRNPGHHAHRMLLGEIHYEQHDFEGACAHLEAARAEAGADEKSDRILMQAYFELGAYEQARQIAEKMLAEEIEAPEIVRLCAVAADRMGDADGAAVYWKRLFRMSGTDAEAASSVLSVLSAKNDLAAADEWAAEVLETIPAHVDAFAFRWERNLQRGDREGLLSLARGPVVLDEAKALHLVQLAFSASLPLPAVALARSQNFHKGTSAAAREWVAQSALACLQVGTRAFEGDDLAAAAEYLQSAWLLKPLDNALVRARRALGQKMRKELRQEFIAKRYERVFQVGRIAIQTEFAFPELYSLLGRAHFALGNFDQAFSYLKQALQEEDASVNERVQYARAASRCNRYSEALAAYTEILEKFEGDSWAGKEAEIELARLETRATRAVRDLVTKGQHDAAGALLQTLRTVMPQSPALSEGTRRLLAALRADVRALEPASADRRLALGMKILDLDPEDDVGLRAAAVGAMRTYRFSEALKHWNTLRPKVADPAQIDLNIQKCLLWNERVQRRSAARECDSAMPIAGR